MSDFQLPPPLSTFEQRADGKTLSELGVRPGMLVYLSTGDGHSIVIVCNKMSDAEVEKRYKASLESLYESHGREIWNAFCSRVGRMFVCDKDAWLMHPLCHLNNPSGVE